jgi:uncharacterized protein YfdQ (DUF2303 family)
MQEQILARLLARLSPVNTLGDDPDSPLRPLAVVPDDHKLLELERFGKFPTRTRKTVDLTTATSFYRYVDRFKTDESVAFVTPNLDTVNANSTIATVVFDYDGPDSPRWGTHKVNLKARPSLPYALLQQLHNKFFEQPEFAKMLKKLARFATAPDAATMLEIVQSLTLTSAGEFEHLHNDVNGSVKLNYSVNVNAKANSAATKKDLEVPGHFEFQMPVMEAGDPQTISCEFRYRIPASSDAKLALGISIVDKEYIEKDALDAVAPGHCRNDRPDGADGRLRRHVRAHPEAVKATQAARSHSGPPNNHGTPTCQNSFQSPATNCPTGLRLWHRVNLSSSIRSPTRITTAPRRSFPRARWISQRDPASTTCIKSRPSGAPVITRMISSPKIRTKTRKR